jgi:hypothetical protein
MKRSDLISLPFRVMLFFLFFGMSYYFGYGTLQQEWRQDLPKTGIVACYTRNGRPWRIFYDRDRNGKWDMWIDERAGHPYIVSIDENGDGKPDREEDEWGNPLSPRQSAQLRSHKTIVEFLHNSRQLLLSGFAVLLYIALEFLVRWNASR